MASREELKLKINPFVLSGVFFGIVVIILLIVSIIRLSNSQPYDNETVIDNLSEEYNDLPERQKKLIYTQLYSMIENNLPENQEVPTDGAMIREGTTEYYFDDATGIYYGVFVVDIPEIEQSYKVQFEWSRRENNSELGGYPVLVSCLPPALRIYDNAYCSDMVEVNVAWDNAFQLDYTFGTKTSSEIRDVIGQYFISELGEFENEVSIDADTLMEDKSQPDITYKFNLIFNSDFVFEVTARVDPSYGKEYIVIFINNVEYGRRGFIITYDGERIPELEEWLKNYSGDAELLIETSKMREDAD